MLFVSGSRVQHWCYTDEPRNIKKVGLDADVEDNSTERTSDNVSYLVSRSGIETILTLRNGYLLTYKAFIVEQIIMVVLS